MSIPFCLLQALAFFSSPIVPFSHLPLLPVLLLSWDPLHYLFLVCML